MRVKTARLIFLLFFICVMSVFLGAWLSPSGTLRYLLLVLAGISTILLFSYYAAYMGCPYCHHFLGRDFARYCTHCGKEVSGNDKAGRILRDDDNQEE
jgi:hypothetical protein